MLLYDLRKFYTRGIALGNKWAPINLYPDNFHIVLIRFNSGLYEIVAYWSVYIKMRVYGLKAHSHYDAGGEPVRDPVWTGDDRDEPGTTGAPRSTG